MSIFSGADHNPMSVERGGLSAPLGDDQVAMQLLADGVPLELLVDIALPPTEPVDGSSPDGQSPGYYWL